MDGVDIEVADICVDGMEDFEGCVFKLVVLVTHIDRDTIYFNVEASTMLQPTMTRFLETHYLLRLDYELCRSSLQTDSFLLKQLFCSL